ncbi:hypothetical protein KCU36_002873 [Vibrio vulnificus]|nr:hypothetical protein [Vibrio vulnificus]
MTLFTSEEEKAAWGNMFFGDDVCAVCGSVNNSGVYSGEDFICRDCADVVDVLKGRVNKEQLINYRKEQQQVEIDS